MKATEFIVSETLKRLANTAAFAKRMPPIVRVKRRGFRRDIRRGDDLRWRDGMYRVVRRSRHSLWLEKGYEANGEPVIGQTIRVRVPKRFGMEFLDSY